MSARRVRSLHFGDMEGKNVVFHREHRSKKGRKKRNRFFFLAKDFKRKKEELQLTDYGTTY